ncbi:hypothetical protein ACN38_g6477 [Penicillium nordicum]|uniref:Uncharacterized protein n=1 Tax=Penicillium nordicum TaxID=229535 RepID=A0A0M8P377_9EURO|nr:hypothetical protein ACN38_g6477 [Penicillium nordicum]
MFRGKIARHTGVQELQSAPAYANVYPYTAPDPIPLMEQSESSELLPSPNAHPQSPPLRRWQGPRGFGTRHTSDDVPFTLWDEHTEKFRLASRSEMSYIIEKYQATNPPKPIPLTVACMPTRFVPPGSGNLTLYGLAPYGSHRIADPCAKVSWRRTESPTKSQMCAVVSAVSELANVRRINFFPAAIVVELEHGDGEAYSPKSLPGIVANRPTTYHHDAGSFFSSMRNHTRERILDPAQCLPGPTIGPLPQDATDYIHEPNWGILTPGMRVSTGYAADSGVCADANFSTTTGILLRKGTNCYITVANHGFLGSQQIYHPTPYGDKIGDIVERYPELDIAMVQLTPTNFCRYTNQTYFQAQAPRRLAEPTDLAPGTWFEVDGMSTGMLSLMYIGNSMEKPASAPGHPEVPVHRWRKNTMCGIFGATNPQVLDGICGAPLVEEESGLVGGFFHLAAGEWAECAALDDLIAEGWEVV